MTEGHYPSGDAVGPEGHVFGHDLRNQPRALGQLALAGSHGLTWEQLARLTGWHHGTASGVLSTLHRAGKVERLVRKRNRRSIYVLPWYVAGRETVKPKPNPRQCPECVEAHAQHGA